jgi:hypothetical protein
MVSAVIVSTAACIVANDEEPGQNRLAAYELSAGYRKQAAAMRLEAGD